MTAITMWSDKLLNIFFVPHQQFHRAIGFLLLLLFSYTAGSILNCHKIIEILVIAFRKYWNISFVRKLF